MKKNLNHLGIVVLFWNDSEKTLRCLKSLLNQKKNIFFDIILVDNNSDQIFSNQIFKWLKKRNFSYYKVKKNHTFKKNNKKKIFYIKNKINLGCGLGHNTGYEFCLKNNYEYIARIDNDMIVPKTVIFRLVKRLEDNRNIGAISPKVMFENNPKIIWFGGTKIGNNLKLQKECSNFLCKKKDSSKFKGLIKTDAVVGCASVMRSKLLKKTGLSDPDFFYGEEDIELSQRFRKHGGKLYVDLNQKIYHSVSYTVNNNWAKTIYYNYKYRLLLIKKIGTFSDKFFGYSVYAFKFVIMFLLSFRKKYSSKIVQVYLAGLHFLQKKYGDSDRKKYKLVDIFFKNINKKTSFKNAIKYLYNAKGF